MSWGERSCVNYGNCSHEPTMATCNEKCEYYKCVAGEKSEASKISKYLEMSSRLAYASGGVSRTFEPQKYRQIKKSCISREERSKRTKKRKAAMKQRRKNKK